ncbi:phage capsid protein [Salmonella enterica]|nr:phage capsid protein [Salmonella enterica subsp. enterica serovar Telelkebir]EBC2597287.1 phage capsid protein [Salmonella enterica]EBX1543581.1 phage capsid protein [Salmonella enterica subsp. enterica serovar Wa]EBX5861909.1 phage capsid protein [Salmonella enterica subsp. enterica serovar Kingston]ECG3807827.1 phage capsid protein [Salmonella enterica subsp. enterica serovar Telelkebir]
MKHRHGRFKNPSVMNHDFSMIPSTNIQRSMFNRSSGYKTTFDSGYLVPFFIDEALPGDTFHMKTSILARLTTPIVPFMDNLKLDYFFFSVPYRLVWDNWQKFNGEQKNPGDSVDYLIPQVACPAGGWPYASMGDYFGLPTGVDGMSVSSLPFRAYNLIYNEWFRDQNLINSAEVKTDDTRDDPSLYPLRKRGKRHDYFTSCLPWPQKGDGVELALGTPTLTVPDKGIPPTFVFTERRTNKSFESGLAASQGGDDPAPLPYVYPISVADYGGPADDVWQLSGWGNPALAISNTDALTINSLRQAFQLQRMLERDARGGTRYTEIIRSHFGVISPDSRVQRPEYLGGGTMDININPVMQTSSTDNKSPQGNLAAFGVSGAYKHGFSHSFVEHCFVIGLVCVRADLTYQQGIPRMFSRQTRYDHYWPTLAHLGEQAVLNKEIYFQAPTGAADDPNEAVFGYQERYAEYRYAPSKITGKMRSTDPQTLDVWHLSQKFDSLPTLNQEFIEENPPVDRVIAVQDEPQFMMDVFFDLKCARPMPTYSVPGYIDHF